MSDKGSAFSLWSGAVYDLAESMIWCNMHIPAEFVTWHSLYPEFDEEMAWISGAVILHVRNDNVLCENTLG